MYVNNDIDYMRWLLNKNLFIFGGGGFRDQNM